MAQTLTTTNVIITVLYILISVVIRELNRNKAHIININTISMVLRVPNSYHRQISICYQILYVGRFDFPTLRTDTIIDRRNNNIQWCALVYTNFN